MTKPVDQPKPREGNAELIRGVALFDTPEPGTGKMSFGCTLPGEAALVVYPGSEVCLDSGAAIIFADESDQLHF